MRYLADTTFLVDLVTGDPGAAELSGEPDASDERVGISVVSAEEYFRGIHYLYGGSDKLLRRKLAEAKRDLSVFEVIPFDYDVALKAVEHESLLMNRG